MAYKGVVTFRYYRDARAGWGFEEGSGNAAALERELTDGSLRLSRFSRELAVTGHLERGGKFFVVHKPEGEAEIVGKVLSELEYKGYGFDPFSVTAEAFGVVVPDGGGIPAGGGPWTAETAGYMAAAAAMFRRLPISDRRHDYLSVLPEGSNRSDYRNTRFVGRVGGGPYEMTAVGREPSEREAIKVLGEVVRRLEREVVRLGAVERAAVEAPRSSQSTVEGESGPRNGVGRVVRWFPALVTTVLVVLTVIAAASARRDARSAEDAAGGASTQAGRAADHARSAEEAAGEALGAADTETLAQSGALEHARRAEEAAARAAAGAVKAAAAADVATARQVDAAGDARSAEEALAEAEDAAGGASTQAGRALDHARRAEEAAVAAAKGAMAAAAAADVATGRQVEAAGDARAAEEALAEAEDAAGTLVQAALEHTRRAEAAAVAARDHAAVAREQAARAEKFARASGAGRDGRR